MGKGGGKGHTPREAPDNLKSTQLLSVIDAISEGPIEGPVNGLQSVLVNQTPVVDRDGNTNIHGVKVVYRVGEQEQTPLEGFESSGAETVLGVQVKYDNPVTRTITAANIDRLRFTFGVQSLVEANSKGDRNPTSVRLQIHLERYGQWVVEKEITITGKTTTQYRRASGHVSDRCLFGLHHFTCRGYQRFSEGSWAVHHVCFRLAAGDGFPVGEQLHKLTGFPVSFV